MRSVSRRKILGASLGGLLGAVGCTPPSKTPQGPQNLSNPDAAPGNSDQTSTPSAHAPASREPSADFRSTSTEKANEPEPQSEATNDASAPGANTQVCERLESVVGRNHGHELLIPETDVLASVEKTYSLKGASSHDHMLVLSKEEFAQIGRGETLRKKTEFGAGHRHRILVRCRPQVLPPDLVSACEAIIAGEDGHEIIIPEADVRAGVERRYDIQGVSGHTHALVVRSEDFRRLLAGEKLDLQTEKSAGHFHHAYIRYLGRKQS